MTNDPRYEVKNPEIEEKLKEIGRKLHELMPEGCGFCLLMMEFGENGGIFYFSDCEMEGVTDVMKKFIARNTQ